jgi:tRNA A37 threonylcarbamoyladenosine biosynthesis protein TsaE
MFYLPRSILPILDLLVNSIVLTEWDNGIQQELRENRMCFKHKQDNNELQERITSSIFDYPVDVV